MLPALSNILKTVLRPVRLPSGYFHPLYISPSFGVLSLLALLAIQWDTAFISIEASMPEAAEWMIVLGFGLLLTPLAGFLPILMVKVQKSWGFQSVQRITLLACISFILLLWINPNVEISVSPTILLTSSLVGLLFLVLWPCVEYMGTVPDPRERDQEKWILFNAVSAALRRKEITSEEAAHVNPFTSGTFNLSSRLRDLPTEARLSIQREIRLERLLQDHDHKYDR